MSSGNATPAGAEELEGAPAELLIQSSRVSVWKRGGWLAFLIVALVVTLIGFGGRLEFAIALGAALELWRRVHAGRWARGQPARVLVDANGGKLVIERDSRRFSLETSKITDCWQRTDADTGGVQVLAVSPRAQLSVEVADRASANALSRALGVDVSSHLVGTTLTALPTLPRLTWQQSLRRDARSALQWSLYLAAPIFLFYASMTTLSHLPLMFLPLAILLASLMMFIRSVSHARTPARVYVGRDGLFITTADRREFIGYERVRRVQSGVLAVQVELSDGQIVKLPLSVRAGGLFRRKPHPLDEWVRDVDQVIARRRTLVQQINDALTRFRDAGSDIKIETVARLLDRGSRPIPEWRQALSQLRAGAYRGQNLDAQQLVNVLENPRLPLGQRLGAALALAGRADRAAAEPGQKSRVRAAIASSANPKVRILLERAAEGQLDEAAYERAVEAEAEAERRLVVTRG